MGPKRKRVVADTDVRPDFTPFLDLIFNILAFFVVTYRVPYTERNFDISLPPPKVAESNKIEQDPTGILAELFNQVTIVLEPGGEDGAPGKITIEGKAVSGGMANLSRSLRQRVAELGGTAEQPIETATIVSGEGVKFRFVVQTVDACTQANIKKIKFGGK